MKIDPPIWIDADFKDTNKSVGDPQKKTLYMKIRKRAGCNLLTKPSFQILNV